MKYAEIGSLVLEDLQKKKTELVQELFVAKMKNRLGQLSQPLQIRFMRKDLARVETALTKVRAQAPSAPASVVEKTPEKKSAAKKAAAPKTKKSSGNKE